MKGFHVRRGAHWIVISLFLAVAGCGGDSGTNSGGNTGNTGGTGNTGNTGGGGSSGPEITTDVTVGDDFFDPTSIQVSPGAMVTWTWSSNRVHNVTFADNAITDSGNRGGGMYATAMPMATGDYTYLCTIHPSTMQATVTVE